MKCIRCKAKSTVNQVVAGHQVTICTKCYNAWLDKKDEVVAIAFELFFPAVAKKKGK